MSMTRWVKGSRGWSQPGIDAPPATIHSYDYRTVIFKIPGHTYWGGIGVERPYAPAEFKVVRITDGIAARDAIEGKRVIGETLVEFPVRSDLYAGEPR